MFDFLKKHERIMVTGPQRSGTTISTKIIATELNYKFLKEEEFGTHNFNRFYRLITSNGTKVIQAPALSHICHLLPDEIAIVFIMRNIEDIKKSEHRVNWHSRFAHTEYKNYFVSPTSESHIAEIKYNTWNTYQKPKIKHWYEIQYEDMSKHPLWIDKDYRKHFGMRQIEVIPKKRKFFL